MYMQIPVYRYCSISEGGGGGADNIYRWKRWKLLYQQTESQKGYRCTKAMQTKGHLEYSNGWQKGLQAEQVDAKPGRTSDTNQGGMNKH